MKVCSPSLETPEWNSPRDEWWKNKWRENKWREVKRRKDKWREGKRRKDKWVKTGRFAAPSQETNWFQFSWYWGGHPWHNKWSKDYGQSARQNQVRQSASVPREFISLTWCGAAPPPQKKDKALKTRRGKLLNVYFGGCKVIARRIRVHSIAWKKNCFACIISCDTEKSTEMTQIDLVLTRFAEWSNTRCTPRTFHVLSLTRFLLKILWTHQLSKLGLRFFV